MKLRVLLDANVLYGYTLRDTFMHLAVNKVIEVRWTNQIHEEWIEALLENRADLTREKLGLVRSLMDLHATDALVSGFEPLIETLTLPDPDDRHVLAAAIYGGAQIIVTQNLKDFPSSTLSQFGLRAQHPDAFLVELLRAENLAVLKATEQQRALLRKPARTMEEHLEALKAHGLPRFSAALRQFYLSQ